MHHSYSLAPCAPRGGCSQYFRVKDGCRDSARPPAEGRPGSSQPPPGMPSLLSLPGRTPRTAGRGRAGRVMDERARGSHSPEGLRRGRWERASAGPSGWQKGLRAPTPAREHLPCAPPAATAATGVVAGPGRPPRPGPAPSRPSRPARPPTNPVCFARCIAGPLSQLSVCLSPVLVLACLSVTLPFSAAPGGQRSGLWTRIRRIRADSSRAGPGGGSRFLPPAGVRPRRRPGSRPRRPPLSPGTPCLRLPVPSRRLRVAQCLPGVGGWADRPKGAATLKALRAPLNWGLRWRDSCDDTGPPHITQGNLLIPGSLT
ncbi:translation initiation factor IF-2-like [Choloepus didactylus]|uniref:translation initiation factor IF-2-like n=1 Tax=Choloepus didactylus TaxID=27675 RepID=UPI00189CA881|nr:translation initiation factor IF-2-like [Choloepus didactylus]